MAGVIKVNGLYHKEDMVSRDLFFKVLTPTGTTRALIEADLAEIHLTSTIEVIGDLRTTEDIAENKAEAIAEGAAATAAGDTALAAYWAIQETYWTVGGNGATATTTVNLVLSGADVTTLTVGAIADIAGWETPALP